LGNGFSSATGATGDGVRVLHFYGLRSEYEKEKEVRLKKEVKI